MRDDSVHLKQEGVANVQAIPASTGKCIMHLIEDVERVPPDHIFSIEGPHGVQSRVPIAECHHRRNQRLRCASTKLDGG
jgi:hypothetical protein